MTDSSRPVTAAALARAQAALLWEHPWPWLPAYLDAALDPAVPPVSAWAGLMRNAVSAEIRAHPVPPLLPLALRAAPAAPAADSSLAGQVGALLPPVRSGIIVTRHRLADAGVGHRIGERRFTLRAMLEQNPAATLSWLAAEPGRWARRHASRAAGGGVSQWWAARAAGTTRVLRELAARTSMSTQFAGVIVP